jgi:LPPG:FO 2-phospho-L-lactate transferase
VAPVDGAGAAPDGVTQRTVPLLMSDVEATAAIAGAALDLAADLAGRRA